MKLNYPRSGRSNKVRYENIIHWNYSDSSQRKMDVGLAKRIGIIGLLFTKVEHQHVFTIIHKDEYGDRQVAILDFDNKEFVLQIKAALSDITEIKLTNKIINKEIKIKLIYSSLIKSFNLKFSL